jgi:pyrroloquinoline quinone biosynthesis protein D
MAPPAPGVRPCLALGCRLSEALEPGATLLMPERAMRLNGPGLHIVRRCDGQHTVQDIVHELQALYASAEPAKIEQETCAFLEQLHERRAVDFK